jgi:hypothetical protein
VLPRRTFFRGISPIIHSPPSVDRWPLDSLFCASVLYQRHGVLQRDCKSVILILLIVGQISAFPFVGSFSRVCAGQGIAINDWSHTDLHTGVR